MTQQTPLEAELAVGPDVTDVLHGMRVASQSVAFTGASLWLGFDEENYALAFETWLRDHLQDPSRPIEAPTDRRYDVYVVAHDGVSSRSTTLRGVHARFPLVQLLPDEEILIVGARCRFTRERVQEEENAYVFGWDGTERRHFLLGDAIESVQVTREGHIWVSYFDEGVYGGLTWGAESDPPAAAGLLTTDPYGRILWRYRAPAGIGRIDDCYALNVGRREAWAYYYSDFPLVRIDSEGVVTAWTTEIAGARAFAVTNDCVLFCGGYRDRRWDTVLWKLGEGVLEDPREVHLVMPRGVRPERDATYVGRGSMLTVFDGPRWYQVDLRDLPS